MRVARVFFLLCVAAFGSVQLASAVLVTHSDRTAWNVAVGGGPDYTVDFNAIATDVSYNDPDTFDAGPFTLGSIGTDVRVPEPLNYVDASPFRVNTFSIDGSTVASSRLGANSTAITISFDEPISAFGGDFARISDSTPVTLTLNRVGGGTDDVMIPSIGATPEFFGVVGNPAAAYSSLSFTNSGVDEFWLMDNLSAVVAVPEPSQLLLLGAVVALTFSSRRKPRCG